jgi:hypothetical protein
VRIVMLDEEDYSSGGSSPLEGTVDVCVYLSNASLSRS